MVTCLHRNEKDVGLNPTATKNEKNGHWGTRLQEVAQGSEQDLEPQTKTNLLELHGGLQHLHHSFYRLRIFSF